MSNPDLIVDDEGNEYIMLPGFTTPCPRCSYFIIYRDDLELTSCENDKCEFYNEEAWRKIHADSP